MVIIGHMFETTPSYLHVPYRYNGTRLQACSYGTSRTDLSRAVRIRTNNAS